MGQKEKFPVLEIGRWPNGVYVWISWHSAQLFVQSSVGIKAAGTLIHHWLNDFDCRASSRITLHILNELKRFTATVSKCYVRMIARDHWTLWWAHLAFKYLTYFRSIGMAQKKRKNKMKNRFGLRSLHTNHVPWPAFHLKALSR